MKKLFLFAAAAAMFAACSETEVLDNNAAQEALKQGGVKFDVYTQRAITRGGGYTGDITNETIIGENKGFGVFAYYTPGETYSTSATPNFMYNQKIWSDQSPATYGTLWKYEPVKYWPNEYGNAAISDEVDKVSFFAYAPWTEVEPTTGEIVPKAKPDEWDEATQGSWTEHEQKKNIISVNKNSAQGDPMVKYVVDTNPATSVDLLWGVVAENAEEYYTPIDGKEGSKQANKDVKLKPGFPFIDLVKPNDPVDDRLVFNLKHALAKVRVTIDYIADQKTPEEGNRTTSELADAPADKINADETRIWVRQFNIEGWAGEGALNLNNTEGGIAGMPLWKDIDGVKDINFKEVIYQDGLKDGAEGQGKIDKGESLTGLNPAILEDAKVNEAVDGKITKFSRKNPGVGAMTQAVVKAPELKAGDPMVQREGTTAAVGTTLLFGGDPTVNGGYFYVIPRNSNEDVNVKIIYDVETIDPSLAEIMSDKVTKGSSIENVIEKHAIFGTGVDFEAGKQYDIHIHLGMTSVKIEATVQAWVENGVTVVDLPKNQDPEEATDFTAAPDGGTTYYYVSYFDKDDDVAIESGTVKVLENTDPAKFVGSYVGVKVQDPSPYAGNIFYISKNATPGTKTQLLKLEDNVLKATGIWVVFDTNTVTAPEPPVYNFTCPAYGSTGTAKVEPAGVNLKITVVSNSIDEANWIGKEFYAKRPAKVGDSIQLYKDAACEQLANLVVTIGTKI